MKRRIMSIFVTVLMVFAMMPMTALPAYAESYNLWVGGVQITSENCNAIQNVLTQEGTSVTGAMSYDPSTKTLTLDNFSFEGPGESRNFIDSEDDLTISLIGGNYIKKIPYGAKQDNSGIHVGKAGIAKKLVIQDDPSDSNVGELTIDSMGSASITCGIWVYGDLDIKSGKVTTNAHSDATGFYRYGVRIGSGGTIKIEGGSLLATAEAPQGDGTQGNGRSAGLYDASHVFIKGEGELIASGHTKAIWGAVTNEKPGRGWTDAEGTAGEETIDPGSHEDGLVNQNNESFKKVYFKSYPLLTITAKDQTYEYDGETHGPGDVAYDDPAEIAELVTVDGLQEGDSLSSIIVDGQGNAAGTYDLIPYGAKVKGDPATDKYTVTYVNGTLTINGPAPEPQPEPKPEPKPTPAKVSGTPIAKTTATGKTSLTIEWNKVEGADGYDIFFAQCKHDEKKAACKNVKTIEGNDTFKWTKSGLRKGIPYKAYVKAYVMQDGVKKYVKTSPVMHAYTGNGTKRYTNAKSVSVNKTKVTLKQGKKFKIKAKVNKVKKGKTLMSTNHASKLRYLTSDSSIAKVSKSGKITAKGKGTCDIYVYAHNGVYKKIKVTVK